MKLKSSLYTLLFIIFYLLSLTPVLSAEEKTILFLGDSLTEGYGVLKDESYPELIKSRLLNKGKKGIRIINAGISGSTSASASGRLKWYKRANPDLVILALGGNDGLRGFPIKSIKQNLKKTISWAKSNQIKILLAGIKIPPNYGLEYTKKFEAVFKELANEENIPFLPFLLEGVAGDPALMQPDGIHPNAKGHKVMADMVYQFIQSEL